MFWINGQCNEIFLFYRTLLATTVIMAFESIVIVPLFMSFAFECAGQGTSSPERVPNLATRLSPGDTILVSIRSQQPPYPVPVERRERVLDDASISFYKLKVAALTPEEAAAKIRKALIMDLYGVQIGEVKVVKVQQKSQKAAKPPQANSGRANESGVQWSKAVSVLTNSPMTTARCQATATLLPNGRVLVAGGNNSTGDLSSAELFDPQSRSWTATGSLPTTRNSHTAVILVNGKVLVAGGYDDTGIASSAAVYDPAPGTWRATGAMTTPRYGQTMILLDDGRVLVAGGSDGKGGAKTGGIVTPSAELYEPDAEAWKLTGAMHTARYYHTATLLPDHRVLVAGGGGVNEELLSSAEIYDPRSGEWTVTGSLQFRRCSHTATLLANGKVLVMGGFGEAGVPSSAELFDPTTCRWSSTGSANVGHINHTATLLPSGQVLVLGSGTDASAELYNPATGSWQLVGSLTVPRAWHTATLTHNSQVLVAGGFHNGEHLCDTALYELTTTTD